MYDMHCVWLEGLDYKHFFNWSTHYFITLFNVKYSWILSIPSISIDLQSSKKSCKVPFKKTSLFSFFVKSNNLPKQNS